MYMGIHDTTVSDFVYVWKILMIEILRAQVMAYKTDSTSPNGAGPAF